MTSPPAAPAIEGEEMREAIARAIDPGAWSAWDEVLARRVKTWTMYSDEEKAYYADTIAFLNRPGRKPSLAAADAILSGPLAQLRSDLQAAQDERDEALRDHTDMMWQRRRADERAEAAESEAFTLRETVAKLKEGQDFLQEVYEATIARWRDAALLAVGGDLRKVQRLLDASSQRVVGSALREISDEEKSARAAALADAQRREKEARAACSSSETGEQP